MTINSYNSPEFNPIIKGQSSVEYRTKMYALWAVKTYDRGVACWRMNKERKRKIMERRDVFDRETKKKRNTLLEWIKEWNS
jgi:hypothetical protein